MSEEIKQVYPEARINLVEGSGGVFQVSDVFHDGTAEAILFSKQELKRFPEEGEIIKLIRGHNE